MKPVASELNRYLNACYPGHQRLNEPNARERAIVAATKAFPGAKLDLDFIFLRSRRRHFEQFVTEEWGNIIIVDEGLSSLTAMQDILLSAQDYTTDHGFALNSVPFAEAFLREEAFERAVFCAARAKKFILFLENLQQVAIKRSQSQAMRLFLLLHEIAHLLVDQSHPLAKRPLADVNEAIDIQIAASRQLVERLRGDDRLSDLDTSLSSEPSAERDLFASQTEIYLNQISATEEIEREATCDLMAMQGLVRYRLYGHLSKDGRQIDGITWREIGDLMLVGMRSVRILMAREYLLDSANSIASGSNPSLVNDPPSHIMIRFNVLANLVFASFERILKTCKFSTPSSTDDPGANVDPVQRLLGGIKMVNDRTVERLFNPINQIALAQRDMAIDHPAFQEEITHLGDDIGSSWASRRDSAEVLIQHLPL